MKKKQFLRANPQSGAIGFLVVLLATAVAVIGITVLTSINRKSQQTTTDVEKDTYSYLAAQEADNIVGNLPTGVTYKDLVSGFSANNDQGVTFFLPAGETVELDPTVNSYCKTSSCVIKVWWHNDANATTCSDQASLLVSEYSQDGSVCEDGYSTECAAGNQSRNGELNERARYYLFRPYACVNDTDLAWAGYETAFGTTAKFGNLDADPTATSGRSIVGVGGVCDDASCDCKQNPAACYSGSVTGSVSKYRQEFRYNQDLSKSFANYYEIPVWPNTTVVRIKALYANTYILVDLPGQIIDGTSVVTGSDGTSSTVKVIKTLEQIPSVFDFALFAGSGSITKDTE